MTETKVVKPKATKKVPIKVISSNAKTALVEWADKGETCRGYVPVSLLEGDSIDAVPLEAALPYGVPWAELIKIDPKDFPARLQKALHNANIWTLKDASNLPALRGALQAALQIDTATVLATARNFEKGE